MGSIRCCSLTFSSLRLFSVNSTIHRTFGLGVDRNSDFEFLVTYSRLTSLMKLQDHFSHDAYTLSRMIPILGEAGAEGFGTPRDIAAHRAESSVHFTPAYSFLSPSPAYLTRIEVMENVERGV